MPELNIYLPSLQQIIRIIYFHNSTPHVSKTGKLPRDEKAEGISWTKTDCFSLRFLSNTK